MRQTRQEFLCLKGECTIYHNGLQLNSKKKSKLASIMIDPKSQLLTIEGKGEGQQFKFPIQKLKTIHRKFIQQGKITLEFDEHVQGTIEKGLHNIKDNIQNSGIFQIFIDGASKENLQLLIQQLIKFRKARESNQQKRQNQKEQRGEGKEKKIKRTIIDDQEEPGKQKKLSKRDLMNLINNGGKIAAPKKKNEKQVKKSMNQHQNTNIISLVDFPHILLNQIFCFAGFRLSNRLISKKFQSFVLRNIFSIRLKEDIDEQSFNKLCRWAVNVQCRMKNVKKLQLSDRFDFQELYKNRAKTLRFGNWKQITHKNINQLKGLRIYCLQIPYQIKFELSHLFGLRLVQLRLKGKQVHIKNSLVKDQDILYLINNVKQLRVIEVSYASTKLLEGIKDKAKMEQLRIGVLNKVSEQNWRQLNNFSNLRVLGIQDSQNHGVKTNHIDVFEDISWPERLETLDLGINVSIQSRKMIPISLKQLKLLGDHWRNQHFLDLFLPALQRLDIYSAPLFTHECLENLANVHVYTNWNNNRVEYAKNFYAMQNLKITTSRGFTYC